MIKVTIFFDIRTKGEYKANHIRGFENISVDNCISAFVVWTSKCIGLQCWDYTEKEFFRDERG